MKRMVWISGWFFGFYYSLINFSKFYILYYWKFIYWRWSEAATSSFDGAAESLHLPDTGSICCIVSAFKEVFHITSCLNFQNYIKFMNLITERGSEITVLSFDRAVESFHLSDIGFKYIFRLWKSNVLSCLFTPTRVHRIESLGLFDLCSQREHSSLCSTTEFVLLIRKTPLYSYIYRIS